MLKLEKIKKTHELHVRLRSKSALLSPFFLKALGWAVFLHAFAFFVFHIAPFKIGYQNSLFPPVNVVLERPFAEGGILVDPQGIDAFEMPSFFKIPEFQIPSLPRDLENSFLFQENGQTINPSFTYFERNHELINPLDLPLENKAFLSVKVSGAIAEMWSSETANDPLPSSILSPVCFSFKVLLDVSRGEICWWELDSSEKKNLKEALGYLKNLKFHQDANMPFLSGNVEIAFHPKEEAAP